MHATFALDPYHDSQPLLTALGQRPTTWNGFSVPLATYEQVSCYIAEWRHNDPNGVWGDVFLDDVTEQGSRECHYLLTVTRSDTDDPQEWERWEGFLIDGPDPVFALEGWCWVEAR